MEKSSDLRITLETGNIAYSNVPIKDYATIISNDLKYVAETEGVHKLIVGFDHDNTLEFIKNTLSSDLYYSLSNGNLIQIMDINARKWNGIKYILDKMGCKPENTAYFGDDFDDILVIRIRFHGGAADDTVMAADGTSHNKTVQQRRNQFWL